MRTRTHRLTEDMSEDELYSKLAALIMALAEQRVFLIHTDHLDDAALYQRLTEALHEGAFEQAMGHLDASEEPEWSMLIDLNRTHGPEALDLYLRHYADEAERAWWATHRPIPPHEDPPFERDRTLPRPEAPLGQC